MLGSSGAIGPIALTGFMVARPLDDRDEPFRLETKPEKRIMVFFLRK
jgi:hypothetical protein